MQQAEKDTSKVQKHILYGGQLFKKIFDRQDAWEEIVSYLERNKQERSNEILTIPDPDTSEEMLEALRMLKQEKPGLLRKLLSDNPTYELLRTELFPTGANLARLDD
jgi:hypothetical protein